MLMLSVVVVGPHTSVLPLAMLGVAIVGGLFVVKV